MGKSNMLKILKSLPSLVPRPVLRPLSTSAFRFSTENGDGNKVDRKMSEYVLKLRGLPWSTSPTEIKDFFKDCRIANDSSDGIHMWKFPDGRLSGEAFVEFESQEELEKGLKKNRQYLGERYVDVFESTAEEMKYVLSKTGEEAFGGKEGFVVKIRGLPWDSTNSDIRRFFEGLDMVHNGIIMVLNRYNGKPKGEAFVQFTSKEDAEKALERHEKTIGKRYIEVYKSSMFEATRSSGLKFVSSGGETGARGGEGYAVRMGGLPYKATKLDITEWFANIAQPQEIQLGLDPHGRPSGEAMVYFSSERDAKAAMGKDRAKMDRRYILLYYEGMR